MFITPSSEYALIVVGYVALNGTKSPVMTSDVSDTYGIPHMYLAKIMQQLVRANILISKRGPYGGFILARSDKEITMLEVIEAVDGPLPPMLEIAEYTKSEKFVPKMVKCWEEAFRKAKEIFQKANLSQIIK